MRIWRLLSLTTVVSLLAGAVLSQEATSPGQPFSDAVRVHVVNVEVFVNDKEGQPVVGLTEGDFVLTVGGERVPITNFYAEVGGRATAAPPAASASRRRDEPQTYDSTLPADQRVHVVILIDHTRLRAPNRKRVLSPLRDFLDTGLSSEDVVTVASYTGSLRIHADFLFDRQAIGKILDEVAGYAAQTALPQEAERRQIFGELSRGQSGGLLGRNIQLVRSSTEILTRIRAYAQVEYAAGQASIDVLRRLVSSLAGVPGRKSLIYISDGIPNRPGEGMFVAWRNTYGSGAPEANPGISRFDFNTDYSREIGRFDLLRDFEQVVTQANGAAVTLYTIDGESDHATQVRSAGLEFGATTEALEAVENNLREPLEFSAHATGGLRFQASPRLAEDFRRIVQDIGTYYSLGFSPDPGGEERRLPIKVEVKRKGLVVRHRRALSARDADHRAADTMLSALVYNTTHNPLGFAVHPQRPERRDDGVLILPALIEIPVKEITLLPGDGVFAGSLTFFVTVKDRTGDSRRVQKIPFHLAIPADRMEQAMRDTAHYTLPVVLRSGDQQLVVGIRDEATAVTSTLRLDLLEVP